MTQSYGIYFILNQNKYSGFALDIKVIKSYFNFFMFVEKHLNVIIQYHVLSYISQSSTKKNFDRQSILHE